MTGRSSMTLAFSALVGLMQMSCSPSGVDADFEQPPETTYVVSAARLQHREALVDVQVAQVSQDFFAIIDRAPWLGRVFLVQDYEVGAGPVLVLSQRLWEERLGGRPEMVGEVVRLDGRVHRVIGVMPPAIEWPPGIDLWMPQVPLSPIERRRRAEGA